MTSIPTHERPGLEVLNDHPFRVDEESGFHPDAVVGGMGSDLGTMKILMKDF